MRFTELELAAMKAALRSLAKLEREDVLGVLMKGGAFDILTSEQLVALARKIEFVKDPTCVLCDNIEVEGEHEH